VVTALGRTLSLWCAFCAWSVTPSLAQSLTVDTVGEALRIRGTGFSILQGEPLTRLHDGRTVRLELTAMVLPAPGGSATVTARRIFALSYDLWEERFAVTTVEKAPRSASHLARTAVEAWCLEQLGLPLTALGPFRRDTPFWIRVEYRMLDVDGAAEQADSGYTLQALIEALSRRRKTAASSHAVESGPFRLNAQNRPPPRGSTD
jgi:hypothetical protein